MGDGKGRLGTQKRVLRGDAAGPKHGHLSLPYRDRLAVIRAGQIRNADGGWISDMHRSYSRPWQKELSVRTGIFQMMIIGLYKIPAGSHIWTCFSSDFFHPDADEWRDDAWQIMHERSDCTFFMITKRPERVKDLLPSDWGQGWEHVTIAVTCENQTMADKRLPIYLNLPLKEYAVMVEPMLSAVNLLPYIKSIDSVSVGGESGPDARACDYNWVLDLHDQCIENGVAFSYHQTGAKLIKDGKNGIVSALNVPDTDEFDLDISMNLTRSCTIATKELFKDRNHYRFVPKNVNFDYLPRKLFSATNLNSNIKKK